MIRHTERSKRLARPHEVQYETTVKVTDTIEETDDAGVTTIREKERFSHELRVVFRDGRVAVLK